MFICDVCGKEYKYKNGIYRHKKFECGQEPKYQCPQCPYRAKQKSSLKTHISIKHSDSITNGYYIQYGFNNWPLVQQYSKGFECQVCGKRYKYKRGLHRHKQDECGQEPKYQCPQCPYRAKQKSSLKSHMKIRHEYSFNWPEVHLNESGMYQCDVCGREYKQKYGLNRHKNYECGQEPRYHCSYCPYRAKQKIHLKTHIRIKHVIE
ncbi:hypothetical protein M8J76_003631 [Diaphorina citri]|nr:hypothetical protein M8J76_003631 [Diaphorina citri]